MKSNREQWRPVPISPYSIIYEVSSFGRIRSKRRETKNRYSTMIRRQKILRQVPDNRRGYMTVSLGASPRKTFLVHRLVALAFIPNPERKPQVNHKDGNRINNNLSNLEWVTNKENNLHAWSLGLYRPVLGVKHHNNKAVRVFRFNDHSLVGDFFSLAEACRQLKIGTHTNAVKVLTGKRNHTKGFIFKYRRL